MCCVIFFLPPRPPPKKMTRPNQTKHLLRTQVTYLKAYECLKTAALPQAHFNKGDNCKTYS